MKKEDNCMAREKRTFSLFSLVLVLLVALAACGGGADAPAESEDEETTDAAENGSSETITVGSKDFIEQFVLAHMYALVLEEEGFEVERSINLGGTDVAQAALENGEIDLYPEYTGTALLTVLEMPVNTDQEEVYETVAENYAEEFDLIWLEPAPMNNTQALAMTEERSEELEMTTISEMVEQASDLVMVGPAEFQEREDGLLGLKEVYGEFELEEYKAVDPGLRYRALVDGEADVVVAFGTDGEISRYNLVILEDDEGMFPPYQVAPVVRQDILDDNPGIADALNELSPLLTTDVMQELNNEVSENERDPEDVAREFLEEEGLISE
jgi:osmoprotectant transport system substrate-binding protein